MINTEAMPECHAAAFLCGLLQQSGGRAVETVAELSVWKRADSAGKPGLDVTHSLQ